MRGRPGTAVVVASVLIGACARPSGEPARAPVAVSSEPAPARSAPSASPTSVAEARLVDLETLGRIVASHHPDGAAAAARLGALRGRVGELDDDGWLVALMRATGGRDRDGHTGVLPLAQDVGIWPVQLYDFDDGMHVVAAMAPHEDLVGGAVTAIGGRPVAEVRDLITPLVSRDNAATVRARWPQYAIVPAVLRGLGLEPVLEVDGEPVAPEPLPTDEYAAWSGEFHPLVCPRLPLDAEGDFAVRTVGDAVVVRYDRVARSSGRVSVRELAAETRRLVDAIDARRVVLDVRRNPGGDEGTARPLTAALTEIARERPGALRILVGRSTFSAASLTVYRLLAATDALVVGEPMGGAAVMAGDGNGQRLAATGVIVHVADRAWDVAVPGRSDLLLEPDVAVPVRWSDRSAGVDAALEAALAG